MVATSAELGGTWKRLSCELRLAATGIILGGSITSVGWRYQEITRAEQTMLARLMETPVVASACICTLGYGDRGSTKEQWLL